MKKLILSAVMACVAGFAFASGCEIGGSECPYAYRVKLVGKTVKGVEKAASSECETGDCWAKATSFRVAGYIYNDGSEYPDVECECNCPCEGHWDLADNKCVFWDADKKQFFCDAESVEVDVYDILRNSGSKDKCQVGFKIGDLYLAGFGDFNPSSGRLKRAAGCFAGTIGQPSCAGSSCEVESVPAVVFKPCGTSESVECEKAVAFGKWRMAWKSEKVAMLKKGVDPLTPGCLVPAAFKANTKD